MTVLTKKELTVLEQASKGLNGKQIADNLEVGHQDIKNTLWRVHAKLEVPNTAAAVYQAIKKGLISGG